MAVDTLMIFQGNQADFAYDATVLWHEFGHAVVYSTANLGFNDLSIDAHSANNEGGAMHEAFADYNSATFGGSPNMGPYIGSRISGSSGGTGIASDTFLRTLDNTDTCPTVLWGEVHQDSQHVSGAFWQARRDHFQGSDQGNTFDATWYAMLVSMAPKESFADMAAIMDTHIETSFPGADAGTIMQSIFDARGVTNCVKVIDVTNATTSRPSYTAGSYTQTTLAQGSVIPGPYQMKVHVPNGATSVKVTGVLESSFLNGGTGTPTLETLVRADSEITFTNVGGQLISDAIATAPFTGTTAVTATATVNIACGSDLYVTLANTGSGAGTVDQVTVATTPLANCSDFDAGMSGDGGTTSDAGMTADAGTTPDSGVPPVGDGGILTGTPSKGCGCGEVPFALPLLALAALLRRRKQSL